MRLPNDTQRITIVGATGSGKTMAALWHLSLRNYDQKPWIIYDFKHDETIGMIEDAEHMSVADPLPTQPGVYIVHPEFDDSEAVEQHMREIWNRENIGVYIDEGHMIANHNRAFRAILTQGRSKRIPMIVLSQRPVWLDRFVFTESEFFQVFRLQSTDDLKTIQKFIPFDLSKRLPEYNSYYYDVGQNTAIVLEPVPDRDALLDTFDLKLGRMKKVIR